MPRSRSASAMKSHSHILRWSMTSRPSSSAAHIGRSRSAQVRRAGERSDSAEHSCERSMTGRPYMGDMGAGLALAAGPVPEDQIRSKFRASSQSVTWRLLASHSCSAVLRRWWCTSGPKASSATAESRSSAMASTSVEGMRGTSVAS